MTLIPPICQANLQIPHPRRTYTHLLEPDTIHPTKLFPQPLSSCQKRPTNSSRRRSHTEPLTESPAPPYLPFESELGSPMKICPPAPRVDQAPRFCDTTLFEMMEHHPATMEIEQSRLSLDVSFDDSPVSERRGGRGRGSGISAMVDELPLVAGLIGLGIS